MRLIGLTGSIATGKSTTSHLLSSPPHTLPIIDADLLARKAVEPGTWAYNRIVNSFGPTTPDLLLPPSDPACEGLDDGPSGKGRPLNRPALGRRVFGTSDEKAADRKKLNAIVHPAVRFYMLKSVLWYYIMGYWAVVLDIPLLFESGLDMFVSTVVVVAVSEPTMQMQRLRDRDPHLSEEDARNRVASQTDVREKARRAEDRNKRGKGRGFVLYNDTDKQDLKVQVDDVVRQIREDSPRWWGLVLQLCPPLMLVVAGLEVFRGWRIKTEQERERGKELPKAKL
ncbi:Dephospho-CoA kinase cab5 [Exophiala xenobiotica]|uniref:Dephospho-CoA kinase cab5 n=1 Tax=Lithohypha guttulata TaxID=1690604 RepID=A0ABR0JXQ2_9EURO|nr:Dephospho-CoA kinase cab5 [Lithohypha guttulata]KAK5310299.1 Dephospho-CoA kinase cab5 [Exophiala xenobiotica]